MNKEKIEKAKKHLKNFCEYDDNLFLQDEILYEYQDDIETLLQYIDQLERYLEKISKQLDNIALDQILIAIKELQEENNKLNKMIDEMAKYINESDYNSEQILLLKEKCKDYYNENTKKVKQYFEDKVEEK